MSKIQVSCRSLISISAALAATGLLDTHINSAPSIKDGQDVVSGIKAVASPGHTVGHTSFLITSGDQTLCVTGDVLHHHVPFLTFHFPWPGLGHVTKAGEGFRYIAAPMQMVL